MKRFWAAVIDFIICYILSKILIGWIWKIGECGTGGISYRGSPLRILYSTGKGAVSYTHLTLPTNCS